MRRNLAASLVSALILGAIGVGIWGAVSYFLNLRLGLVAIIIGFMVGGALSRSNSNINYMTGLLALVLTAVTIVLGEYLSLFLSVSKELELGLMETIKLVDYSKAWEIIVESSGIKSLVIYGIALFQAFKIGSSAPELTEEESEVQGEAIM